MTSFFILSKIIGFIIYPLHFIFLLVLVYTTLSYFKILIKLSKIIRFLIFLLILIGGSNYFSTYFLYKLENIIPLQLPNKVDGIILLGGSFSFTNDSNKNNQISFNDTSERVIETLKLLKKYPKSKIVMFAGSALLGSDIKSEAQMAKIFFKNFEISKARLKIEPLANNTYQESIRISDYVSKMGGNWVLVTSASHMPRAVSLFQSRKLGNAKIYTYPCDFNIKDFKFSFSMHLSNFENLSKLIHEYVGLYAYWITGRTKNLMPNLDLIPINHSHI